jgi:hypothetical protein
MIAPSGTVITFKTPNPDIDAARLNQMPPKAAALILRRITAKGARPLSAAQRGLRRSLHRYSEGQSKTS